MSDRPAVRVCVLGSLNTDLVVGVRELPAAGQTVIGGSLLRAPGGKGANQAVAARRLGALVDMVGAVGGDDLGRELLAGLDAQGVAVHGVAVLQEHASGVALIVVEDGGDNTITVAPGANTALTVQHVAAAASTVTAADVLLLQLEVPACVSLAAARLAHEHGRAVVLNAGPLGAADADVGRLLGACDTAVVNEEEGAALVASGMPVPLRLVTTLGARGARWVDHGREGACPAHRVASIDAVGAGDTFAAALAVGLAQGADLGAAVRQGCAAGALATTARGAQTAMPRRDQVDALLGAEAPGA